MTQKGLTLVELMVVIAIVGILGASASAVLTTEESPKDAAAKLAGAVETASRLAIAGGPVSAEVVAAEGSRARARVSIAAVDDWQNIAVERRFENGDGTSRWELAHELWVPTHLEIYGVEAGVSRLDPGGSPSALPGGAAELLCYPDGTCDPATFYVRASEGPADPHRVVVMPLGGASAVLSGW